MDVDLSTDLNALLPLVAPLLSGHSDVAIGTRLARGSRVVRGPKRELISRGYNLLLHGTLGARFSDAQCGFKAIRADRRAQLLPLVADSGWFFDTELLVLAERAGLRIHEVPVDWVDDPDSRVDIVATALADLRGILARPCRDGVPAADRPPRPAAVRRSPGTASRDRRLHAATCSVLLPRGWRAAANVIACWSPRSPTPRPTGGSPSACAAGRACATRLQGLVVFASGWR